MVRIPICECALKDPTSGELNMTHTHPDIDHSSLGPGYHLVSFKGLILISNRTVLLPLPDNITSTARSSGSSKVRVPPSSQVKILVRLRNQFHNLHELEAYRAPRP